MKTTITAVFVFVIAFCGLAHGDYFPPPYETHAISSDGSVVVRVTPGKWNDKGKREPKDRVSIHVYNKETDSYSRASSFDLGDLYPSERLYVSDGGKAIAFVNITGGLALRIYSIDGKLRKKWTLSDLLSPKEIKACALTGSTIQWLEGAHFTEGKFSVHGPAQSIRTWGSPYTVMRGLNKDVSYSRSIDLKTLILKKD